jgi:hypothetical protein
MRYFWASIAAVAIIALGSLFVWRTRVAVDRVAREQRAAKGQAVPVDSPVNLAGVGLEMPSSQVAMVSLADLLIHFRYLLIVLVVLICFGLAAFSGLARRPLSQSSQHRSTENVEAKSTGNAAGS